MPKKVRKLHFWNCLRVICEIAHYNFPPFLTILQDVLSQLGSQIHASDLQGLLTFLAQDGISSVRVEAEVRNVYSSHCLVSVDKKTRNSRSARDLCRI